MRSKIHLLTSMFGAPLLVLTCPVCCLADDEGISQEREDNRFEGLFVMKGHNPINTINLVPFNESIKRIPPKTHH